MAETAGYWYALIAASPTPETEEAANVAVVVGNGHAVQLGYVPGLPRLCGLASAAEAEVYEAILASVTDRVRRGVAVPELEAMVGPQLRVMRRRALYRTPSDALLKQLCSRYLERAPSDPAAEAARALVRRSERRLATELERASVPIGFEVLARVRPVKLYGTRLDKYVSYTVPALSRAVRSAQRDLLIDSVLVEPGTRGRPLNQTATRVGKAFWAYRRRLRPFIRELAQRDVRVVGVVHAGTPGDDADTLFAREYVKHLWGQDAFVIDGNEQDVAGELRAQMAWLREGE